MDLARKYGETSLHDLEKRSINVAAAPDTGEQVTYQLELVWDTVGWIYFQSGEAERSLSLVRSAWLLGQHAVVGEHLAEIYEKLGKRKEAEHMYLLAMAVPSGALGLLSMPQTALPSQAGGDRSLAEKMLSRYEKLTGHKPMMTETRRLPSSKWSTLPYQELTEMRMLELGKLPGVLGWAAFSVVFSPGRVESASYASGEKSMQTLTDKLKAAHYQVEFPEGSQAKLLRKVEVTCTAAHGCVAMLPQPSMPAAPLLGATSVPAVQQQR
jgi:hypothetical protein